MEEYEKPEKWHPPDYMFPYFAAGLFFVFLLSMAAIIKSHWISSRKQDPGVITNQLSNNLNLHLRSRIDNVDLTASQRNNQTTSSSSNSTNQTNQPAADLPPTYLEISDLHLPPPTYNDSVNK